MAVACAALNTQGTLTATVQTETDDPESCDPETRDPTTCDPETCDPKEAGVQEARSQEARVQEVGVQEARDQEVSVQEDRSTQCLGTPLINCANNISHACFYFNVLLPHPVKSIAISTAPPLWGPKALRFTMRPQLETLSGQVGFVSLHVTK